VPVTNRHHLRWLTATVLVATGCSNSSPFATPPGSSGVTRTSHPSSMFAASSQGVPEGPAAATTAHQTSMPSGNFEPASASRAPQNAITGTFKKTTSAIGNALKIEPKVVPAYDATSLSGQQPEIGADLYYQAGRVLMAQGKPAAAAVQFQQALDKSPRDVRVLISLARLKDQQDLVAEAEQLYRRSLEAEPNNPLALNDLGLFYAKRGRPDAAIETLRQAVRLQPANPRYRNNLAVALLETNRRDEAFAELSAALGPAEAHYNLGYLMAERGAVQAARGELQAAMQLNPAMQEARTMLASLGGGAEAPEPPRHLPPTNDAGPYRSSEVSPAWQQEPGPSRPNSRSAEFRPMAEQAARPAYPNQLPPY